MSTNQEWPRKKILFASRGTEWSISAMLRANFFADFLSADLVVLKVTQPMRSWRRLFRREPAREAIHALERWMEDREKAFERCNYILPGEIAADRLLVRNGDFVREVVRAVGDTAAELVVVAPEESGSGLSAIDIALAAKVPVLIARPPRSHNIVVAATNLADARYPVVRKAGQIGRFMGAHLMLVHNVAPLQIRSGWESASTMFPAGSPRESSLQDRLDQLAHEVPRCTGAIVKNQFNTAHAILETGRQYDADLIVVGVQHESSRIERAFGGNVPARVAEHALRSVLLTPIGQQPSPSSVA